MLTIHLGQKQPGDWYLFAEALEEPIPVPNWLVEQTPPEDRDLLTRALAQTFGLGRRLGRTEGAAEVRTQFKELMQL